jgi:hypothetical protein
MLVKCIDNQGVSILALDKVYQAEQSSVEGNYHIILGGSKIDFAKRRFEVLTSYMVRAKETILAGLVKDAIYEVVEHVTDSSCWMIAPYRNIDGHYKRRFSDPIDDRVPMDSRSLHVVDLIEEKLRKILTTRAYSNECPCGTNRTACRYHE